MLIVGPAIYDLADPANLQVSVFTQTMDQLLPAPLPMLGTIVGIIVLMSASAASAQGLQNLALGLKGRHYIPAFIGRKNQFEVADKPVWIQVGLVCCCFLIFGTHEETYLAIYAAGVFILLSMTGWAVTKRLQRQIRHTFSLSKLGLLVGTILAAFLASVATLIIFEERFLEGAWTYFLFIPILYVLFSYCHRQLSRPAGPIYVEREEMIVLSSNGRSKEHTAVTQPIPIPAVEPQPEAEQVG
jgi:L-asparagine transporter-like permease